MDQANHPAVMPRNQTAIVADLDLRLDAPRRERAGVRFAVAALVALAIEVGAIALVGVERGIVGIPQETEIPVEIVVEPPPPPPPPPAAREADRSEYVKPADDAPREGKADHDDAQVADKAKPAAAPPPPAVTPSPEASKAAEPPPAPEAPKAAQAELPAPSDTATTEAPEKAPSVVAALPQTFDSVPDLDFGGEAMKSPVTGGKARSYYTSQLYGLIYARLHVPALAHAYGRTLTGSVNFSMDSRGRLTQRYVALASGSLELDEAVMQAVGAASQFFPKPPHGSPMGMTFSYSLN